MAHRYELVRADCLEWLHKRAARSIHAVVTDPPYGVLEYTPSELKKRQNGNGVWRLPQGFDGFQRRLAPRFADLRPADLTEIERFHRRLAPLLLRVLVPGGHLVMSSQNLLLAHVIAAYHDVGFECRGVVARVVKTFRGGDRPKGAHEVFPEVSVLPRSCWEPWLLFRKPMPGTIHANLKNWKTGALRRPSKDQPFMDLISVGPARGIERELADHPSVKPQRLMRQLVRAALPLGKGVLLDPFMGSGSTIAAAEHLKIKSIGIERDRDYYRMARAAIPVLADISIEEASRPMRNGQH